MYGAMVGVLWATDTTSARTLGFSQIESSHTTPTLLEAPRRTCEQEDMLTARTLSYPSALPRASDRPANLEFASDVASAA
jgi:hypothetical protein